MAESNTGYVNNFQVYTGAIAGKTETGLAYRITSLGATHPVATGSRCSFVRVLFLLCFVCLFDVLKVPFFFIQSLMEMD
jgi:hypothetical protein